MENKNSLLFKKVESVRMGDFYYEMLHPTGLKIFVYPKKGFSASYAIFGTKYGSIDNCFKRETDNEPITVPEGIAHFLEHKLFESEEGDTFQKFAKLGASANAYTSFESTCYLFSATENIYESLKILLEFVQSPYFTKETVEKEQGIIGQEINMYDDDPTWRSMFNLMQSMYHHHPIRNDIAGTIESINEITPELLYYCHDTFYNLSNMALVIAGNADPEKVLSVCESVLKDKKPEKVERIFNEEPETVKENFISQKMSVSLPIFNLGYKESVKGKNIDEKTIAETEIILDAIASDASPLFKKLYDMQLINESSYSYEFFEGEGHAAIIFSGESKDPEKAAEVIKEEIKKIKEKGIDENSFEISKRSIYGSNVSGLNSSSSIANAIISMSFSKRELFKYIDCLAEISLSDVNRRLSEIMIEDKAVLSLILPEDEE